MGFLPNFLFSFSSVAAFKVPLWLLMMWGTCPTFCRIFSICGIIQFCHSFNLPSPQDKAFIASILVFWSPPSLHHTPPTVARSVILKHSLPHAFLLQTPQNVSHDQLSNSPHLCCPFPHSSPQGSIESEWGPQLCIFRDLNLQLTQGLFTPTNLLRLSCSQNKFQGTCGHLVTGAFHQLLSVFFPKNPKDSRWSERTAWKVDWSSWTT